MPTQVLNRYAAALAAVLGVGLVLHLLPTSRDDSGFLSALFNIGHVAGFAVLGYLLVRWLQAVARPAAGPAAGGSALSRAGVYGLATAAALGLAVVAEALQMPTVRDASLIDIGYDAAGTAAGLLIAHGMPLRPLPRFLSLGAAAAAMLAATADPGVSLAARAVALARFPVLAEFESDLDRRLIDPRSARVDLVPAPPLWVEAGRVARVETHGRRRYEGIAFAGWPRDWSGYETLSLTIAADTPTTVTLRIHDAEHASHGFAHEDRFNRRLEVGPMPRTVRIPLAEVRAAPQGRMLDLSRIQRTMVFMTNSGPTVLYLDRLRLE